MRVVVVACRRMLSWVVCVAILMNALAPLNSHAMKGRNAGPLSDLCISVSKRLAPAALPGGKVAPDSLWSPHCPHCHPYSLAMAPPPAAFEVVRVIQLFIELPQLLLLAPRMLNPWASAHPRAPPSFS